MVHPPERELRATGPWLRLGILLVLGLMAGMFNVQAGAPLRVGIRKVAAAPWHQHIRVLGRVESADDTVLEAPLTGRVQGPFLSPGAIPAGAVVARVRVPGVAAGVRAARASVQLARLELERQRQLAARGLVARQSLDQARVKVQQTEAVLAAAERQQAQSVLRAPFAGILSYRVAAGTVVYRGTPVATLQGRGQPWARGWLTPRQMRRMTKQVGVRWHAGGLGGEATVRSLGRSARADGMVPFYIALPASSGLLPGQWVWLDLALPRRPAWRVPDAAVVWDGSRSELFVVRGGRARAVAVRVLAARAGMSWVDGPLGGVASVVVAGARRLRDGVAVLPR